MESDSKYQINFDGPINEDSLAWKLYQYIGSCLIGNHWDMKKLYPKDEEGKRFFEEGLEYYRKQLLGGS